jgi:hypothetical protein
VHPASAKGTAMDGLSKPAGHSALIMLRSDSDLAGEASSGLDPEILDHLNAIMRAYYNTLLIEPMPRAMLRLLDELDAALKRKQTPG